MLTAPICVRADMQPVDTTASIAPAQPIVIAHRGASGYRPEHTVSSYQLAISLLSSKALTLSSLI